MGQMIGYNSRFELQSAKVCDELLMSFFTFLMSSFNFLAHSVHTKELIEYLP